MTKEHVMEDIDHSMMLAEEDWRSFYEECEECRLLQASLALPEHRANPGQTSEIVPVSGEPEKTVGEEDVTEDLNPFLSTLLTVDGETRLEDKQVQTEGAEEKNPEPSKTTWFTLRQEKERWFVTVNDSPSRPCRRRRQKKVSKSRRTCRERKKTEETGTETDTCEGAGMENQMTQHPIISSDQTGSGLRMDQTPVKPDEFEDAVEFFTESSPSQEDFLEPGTDQSPGEDRHDDGMQDSDASQDSESPGMDRHDDGMQDSDASQDSESPGMDRHDDGMQDSDASQDSESPSVLNQPPDDTSDGISCPPVVTVTTPDGPEAFARAAGHTRPVYAISAFWDEMEKLTINDILQLRSSGPAPAGPEEEPAADAEGCCFSTSVSENYDDSDYGSKPDRSSWDFSASDLDEDECWRRVCGASGRSSLQRESPSSEVSDSMGSDGRETPTPPEDLEEVEEVEEVSWQSRMRKSKSLHDVKELDVEDLLLKSSVLLSDTDGSDPDCVFHVFSGFSLDLPSFYCENEPVPIFSCCRPTVRELTSPCLDHRFLSVMQETSSYPVRIFSDSLRDSWTSSWRISFPDKGSLWTRSAVSLLCFEKDQVLPVISEERFLGRILEEEVEEQRTVRPTSEREHVGLDQPSGSSGLLSLPGRAGVLSTLRQSDMCLVCIALASWVMKSSDADNTDAWKAALLANVSALSAIQYLRHYVRRNQPPHTP